jgi:hypothetical protein
MDVRKRRMTSSAERPVRVLREFVPGASLVDGLPAAVTIIYFAAGMPLVGAAR